MVAYNLDIYQVSGSLTCLVFKYILSITFGGEGLQYKVNTISVFKYFKANISNISKVLKLKTSY